MDDLQELINVFSKINDPDVMSKLFDELFTAKERKDLNLRWRLMKDLSRGKTQREIADDLHISLCKITRGSKILKDKNSVSRRIIEDGNW